MNDVRGSGSLAARGLKLNDWNFQSRGHQCHECGQPFEDGTGCHTILAYENQEYARQDLCEPCWVREYGEGLPDRKGFISHWQGNYETPPPPPPDAIKKSTAEGLLRNLLETNDERWHEASYILAVMLERKRILKVKEQIKERNGRVFVYEQPKSGDLFTIPDPNLKMEELEQVQIEVAALLEHGLPTQGEEWPPIPDEPKTEVIDKEEAPTKTDSTS
ncbi:MAG: hypothetical protein QF685_10355 [Verrucomicrobiota bacterium]|nr:hypothetical protein [Verrucomicrobiota bacterium]